MKSSDKQVTLNLYCGLSEEGKRNKEVLRQLIEKAGMKIGLNQPAEIIKKALEAVK